ncbi:40S ribosomal protein S12 [Capsicum annuum]|nr:40S ribosomal protein S12 [Capsicum annuum]
MSAKRKGFFGDFETDSTNTNDGKADAGTEIAEKIRKKVDFSPFTIFRCRILIGVLGTAGVGVVVLVGAGAGRRAGYGDSELAVVVDRTEREDAAVAVPVAETPAPALGEPMDIMTALQLVLRKSKAHGGLARGLHEGAKVIEKHAAQLCVLAEDCDQPDYVKLVKALCADHNVSLITVPNAKTLGEWAGLCKIDSEGKARKVVGCGCVVVKDYGEETEGLHIVQEYVKSH